MVGLPPEFIRNPATTITLSFGLGAIVGLICSPVAVLLLRLREFRPACWIVVGITSPAVCVLAMLTPMLSVLMFVSGIAFCCAVATAWLVLPRVWDGEGVCWRCGYDLRGSIEAGRCPECATPFHDGAPDHVSGRRSRLMSHPIAALSIVLSLSFAGAILAGARLARRAVPFDDERWKRTAAVSRGRMARDLVNRQNPKGLTEAEVVGLLGPPDAQDDRDLYFLGNPGTLIVSYDPDAVVEWVQGSAFPEGAIAQDFDAERWASGTTEDRLRMARCLFTNRTDLLAGKTRTQIRGLLGTADQRRLIPP